jgi:hypothetical protein
MADRVKVQDGVDVEPCGDGVILWIRSYPSLRWVSRRVSPEELLVIYETAPGFKEALKQKLLEARIDAARDILKAAEKIVRQVDQKGRWAAEADAIAGFHALSSGLKC